MCLSRAAAASFSEGARTIVVVIASSLLHTFPPLPVVYTSLFPHFFAFYESNNDDAAALCVKKQRVVLVATNATAAAADVVVSSTSPSSFATYSFPMHNVHSSLLPRASSSISHSYWLYVCRAIASRRRRCASAHSSH